MKAIGFKKHLKIDDPESLIDFDMEKPTAKGHDLLVKVNAVSVNPVDVGVRKSGHMVLKTPKVIGWDACGVVEEVGSKVSLFKQGDRDRKSTRLNSSHVSISYAVFCLKKKKTQAK